MDAVVNDGADVFPAVGVRGGGVPPVPLTPNIDVVDTDPADEKPGILVESPAVAMAGTSGTRSALGLASDGVAELVDVRTPMLMSSTATVALDEEALGFAAPAYRASPVAARRARSRAVSWRVCILPTLDEELGKALIEKKCGLLSSLALLKSETSMALGLLRRQTTESLVFDLNKQEKQAFR